MSVTIADIESARRVIAGAVLRTPMLPAPRLSALTGAEVFVKYENLQVTNSFKDRGALNKLASLSAAERARGVIAMSAGNHAQSVAYHAARLGIPATIVMPVTTPFVKVAATKSHGATVVLDGEGVAEAQARVEELVRERSLVQVHPYDDDRIIAGQGTIALEMLEDVGDLDCLVIPIGGGGLISGNAIAARAVKPAIEIVGVEAALYPSMVNALRAGNRADGGPTLAEGIAVKQVSGRTVAIVRELVADILLVDEPHLERAVNAYATLQKTVAEGAGAAGLAALLANPDRFQGKQRRPHSLRRQYRPADPCLHHGARTGTRKPHRLVPPEPAGPAGRARGDRQPHRRARRQYSRSRSPPAVPRRAGQGRQARRHHRDARRRACGGNPRRARRRRLSTGAHRNRRGHGVSGRYEYSAGARARGNSLSRRRQAMK